MSRKIGPYKIRVDGAGVSHGVSDGWYYEDGGGLTLVVEFRRGDGSKQQHFVGRIPRRNVINAAKRYQVGRDEA